MSISSGATYVVSKNGLIDTRYTSIPVSVGWNRQLNPTTTIGASVGAVTTDYDGPARVRSITPRLTLTKQLSARLTVGGSVGVSFSSVYDGFITTHSKGFAGDLNACWRGETDNFCGNFSIGQETATALGPSRSINLSANYSKQLGPDDTFQLSGSVNRYSNPTSFNAQQVFLRSTYLRGAASYSRRIGNRLFAGADLAARKILLTGPDPKADVTGTLFVRYRLGDIR